MRTYNEWFNTHNHISLVYAHPLPSFQPHRVMEGVKLYNAKNIQEAQEFYKRALDMDPQYAEGWYRVAER